MIAVLNHHRPETRTPNGLAKLIGAEESTISVRRNRRQVSEKLRLCRRSERSAPTTSLRTYIGGPHVSRCRGVVVLALVGRRNRLRMAGRVGPTGAGTAILGCIVHGGGQD